MAERFEMTTHLTTAERIRLNALKPSTQAQYLRALERFEQVMDEWKEPVARSAGALDIQLERFAVHLFEGTGGRARQTAVCARTACVWLNPSLAGRLPRSTAVTDVVAWNRVAGRSQARHPPISWPLACLVAHRLAAAGDIAAAVAVVVAFEGCLRISEAARLTIGDVMERAMVDARLSAGLVVAIADPKTGHAGAPQSVELTSPVVVGLLREWLAERAAAGATPGAGAAAESLFGRSISELHYAFVREAGRLGTAARFTWHSLRHGGATWRFMAGATTADVMRHGRWRSERSSWHYEQAGRAAALTAGIDTRTRTEGERVAAALAGAFQ